MKEKETLFNYADRIHKSIIEILSCEEVNDDIVMNICNKNETEYDTIMRVGGWIKGFPCPYELRRQSKVNKKIK